MDTSGLNTFAKIHGKYQTFISRRQRLVIRKYLLLATLHISSNERWINCLLMMTLLFLSAKLRNATQFGAHPLSDMTIE